MCKSISNRDRIQLEKVRYCLNMYSKGRLCLPELIDYIESLYRTLSSTSEDWKSAFFNCWVNLESVYAGATNREKLNQNEESIVTDAIRTLENLTNKALNSFEFTQDVSPSPAQVLDENWLYCPICIDAWECSDAENE